MVEETGSTAHTMPNEELASHVWRFEQLVADHSDRLRRIELLLDEIAADDKQTDAVG